jgi:anthranilate synthase component 2
MILIIDNYDSFTYNLKQRLGEIDASLDIQVRRNDKIDIDAIEKLSPQRIIVSPGPCTPNEAGISVDAVKSFHGKLPILGVCLGHQSIGQATGGEIVRAERLMHGKTDQIFHRGAGIFKGLPEPMTATRYHSLVIRPDSLSEDFEVTAWANGPNGQREIMGIEHKTCPTFGLQFHPESFLTQRGIDLLENFLNV